MSVGLIFQPRTKMQREWTLFLQKPTVLTANWKPQEKCHVNAKKYVWRSFFFSWLVNNSNNSSLVWNYAKIIAILRRIFQQSRKLSPVWNHKSFANDRDIESKTRNKFFENHVHFTLVRKNVRSNRLWNRKSTTGNSSKVSLEFIKLGWNCCTVSFAKQRRS